MIMKKIFLLMSFFLATQAVQAGKYFDYDEETQICLFKKNGKKFEAALGNLCIFNKPIKEIKFLENVGVEQRAKVLKSLGFSVLPLISDLSKNSDDFEKDLSLFREMGLMSQIKSLSLETDTNPENTYDSLKWGIYTNRQKAKDRMEKVQIVKDGLEIRDPEIFLAYVKHASNLESLSIKGHLALRGLVKDKQTEAFRNEFYSALSDEEFWQKLTKLEKFEGLEINGLTYPKQSNFWEIQRNAESKRDDFWSLLSDNLKEKNLTHLFLCDLRDAFYPKNLKSLGSSLKSMDSLKKIDLFQNFHDGREGDEGITILADILSDLKNIEEISVHHTGMTQKGASSLLQKITEHPHLIKLNMCCNNIHADLSDLFYDVMETCPNLTNISLCGSYVEWPKSSEREKKLRKNGWKMLLGNEWKKNK